VFAKLLKFRSWHWLWIIPFLISLFISIRFSTIYIDWRKQHTGILAKLSSYKQQLDYLRNPLPIEERAGEVNLGAVAIPSRIFDKNSKLIGEFFTERRTLIPIEKIPKYLIEALIASEDRKFYSHEGINYLAIFRAFLVNLFSFRIAQGGSTITQQLAKILFTDRSRTLKRKIFEYFCAREIEHRFTKREILEMYINLVYMSHQNYGVESSAQYFFGKSAADLDHAEAAMIIGLLPNPKYYSPIKYLQNALNRQSIVLNSMLQMKFITEATKKLAVSSFKKKWNVKRTTDKLTSDIGKFPDRAYKLNLAPFFLNHIRNKLLKHFQSEVITKGGLRIYTTLDYKRQLAAQIALKVSIQKQKKYYLNQITRLRKQGKIRAADKIETAMRTVNGAFITIEPATGYILTMIGGSEFSAHNQFNRALKANRPIGSIMKPFVYYSAISQKMITPATMLEDTPLTIGKKKYKNYDGKFLGKITARTALKKSRNIPAIRVLKASGIDELRHILGDILDLPFTRIVKRVPRELGVALGTASFTPVEVARMYATLVNYGKRVIPRDLLRVEDHMGQILWEENEIPPEATIIDPVAAYITISMMQSIFEEGGSVGWVSSLVENNMKYLPFQIAGKTGTTSDYKDAWFVGATSDEVTAIWIGSDKHFTLGQGRSGGSLCAPVWISYIRETRLRDVPEDFLHDWPLEGTTTESFCNDTGGVPRNEGLCRHAIKDQVFFQGTEPRSYCPLHLPVTEDLFIEQ